MYFRRVLQEFARGFRCTHDGVVIAVLLDAETNHGLTRFGNAIDDTLGPAFFDADHDDGSDIRIRAAADEGTEMQIQIGAELQAAIRMRNRHDTFDIVCDRLGRRIR